LDKQDMDQLYHLLRCASNAAFTEKAPELTNNVYNIAKHLLAGGDYLALIQYCAYYGEKYLLQPTCEAVLERGWNSGRVVEFGAGLGWLGRGLAAKLGYLPTLFVDKRHWAMIDLVADLETPAGVTAVLDRLNDTDVIVMSDFLHCVENPARILGVFCKWPMAILEYMPTNKDYASSYEDQLARYGGNPIDAAALSGMLANLGRKTDIKDLEPHVLILIDKEE